MGFFDSKSSSTTTNKTRNTNFVNNNNSKSGGGGGGSGSALADNINFAESELTTGDITLSDSGAVEAGAMLGGKALDTNKDVVMRAFDDTADSRDFAGLVTGDALDQVTRTTEMALQRSAENIKRSLGFARDSERSEAGLQLETLAPWGLGALVLLALVITYNKG